MTAWQSFFVRGGPVMWPLLGCSLVSLTITIERMIFWWRQRRRDDPARVNRIFRLAERGAFAEAAALNGGRPDFAARMLLAGLQDREHGLSEAIQIEAGNLVERMKKGLSVLDTVITMAPLLGILGTVTGIIRSFDLLGSSEIADPRLVSGGIAEALITTAAGLVIALGTLIPFNYFIARVQKTAKKLEQIATQFEVCYRKGMSHMDA